MSIGGFNNRPPIAQGLAGNIASQGAGIISTRPTAKYMSGARCILKVNGRIAAFAFGVSWNITTAVTEIRTIDNFLPSELAPSLLSVEGTISGLHIPGDGPGVRLWQPDILNFLTQQYIVIEVRDIATNELLFYTGKAMITSRQEDIKVDALSNVSLAFKAIGYRDERDPTAPGKDEAVAPNTALGKAQGLLGKLLKRF